jgi:beta-glucosidase
VGDNEQTSREAWSNIHLGDRSSLNLFGMQDELFNAIHELGKPIAVVLFNGRPNSILNVSSKANSILECWYLGQESGIAVANVLFGTTNPSGKLPISIPRSVGHIPCHYNYKPSARRGYLDDGISALYPFGYGLSYTTFKIENIRLQNDIINRGQTTTVYLDIKNTGDREGSEVVQLYIHDMISSVTRPVKELKGFQKVNLKPNESKTIAMEILPEHLAFTNIDMEFVVEPGDFEIFVGISSKVEDQEKLILKVI